MKRHHFRGRFVQAALMGLMVSGSALADDYTWSVTSDGNYNSTNWLVNGLPGGPPGAADNASILTSGSYTVTLSDSRSITNFTLDAAGVTLNHTGGTYSVSGSMNLTTGTYEFNGASGWSMQTGSTINIGANATINTFTQNSSGITGASTIINSAQFNNMSNGDFAISVTGNVINAGTFHADNPGGFATSNLLINNTGDFTNTGTLSASSGISLGSPNTITLNPTGALNLNSGGNITITNGGAIFIARDVPFASLGSWSITNTGSFGMTNGGTLVMGVNDTLTIDAGKSNFTLNNGNIKGGSIDATGGSLVIRGTGNPAQINTLENVFNIRGTIDMSAQAAPLMLKGDPAFPNLGTNFGAGAVINQLNGTLYINQQSQIDNVTVNAGGDFNATSMVLIAGSHLHIGPTAYFSLGGQNAPGLVGTGNVTNDGTILVRSRGDYPITFTGNFVNNGTLRADYPFGFATSNMLIQNNGTFTNNGTMLANGGINASAPNKITVNPTGAVTLNSGSQLQTTNFGQIEFTGLAVTNNGTINNDPNTTLRIGNGDGTLTNNYRSYINGTLDSNLVVTSTGVVSGSGTITKTVTINPLGTVSPGNSPGSMTVGAGIQLQGDYQWDLGSHTTQGPGTNFDQIKLTSGALTISSTATLHLNLPNGNTLDSFWLQDHTWTIIDNLDAANTINGIITADHIFTGTQPNGFFETFIGGTDNNDLVLHWTYAVPEPTTWLLIGLGGLGAVAGAYHWRRSWQQGMNAFIAEDTCIEMTSD